jgi:RNA polymerase sigma-70 factor, ECF subfamily
MVHDMDDSAAIVHATPVEPSDILDLASSFELFVDAETVRFHSALRLLARDRAEAEDLMQDAFLKVWERWDHVRSLEDPSGYLYRTAMNLHRKRLRRAAVAIRHAIGPRPPRDQLDEVESRDTVLRALATLSPRQRMSLVLMDLLDYSSEEAGRLMGVKATTVRVLVSQGRAVLRDSMGGDLDA